MSERTKFILDDSRLPKAWYNINADLPTPPAPVLHPGTLEPVTPDFLSVLFPMGLILQEISTERYIEIPEPVRDVYRMWRPTPFLRAARLERGSITSRATESCNSPSGRRALMASTAASTISGAASA